MNKTKIYSIIVVLILASVIIPQMALAAWWNPFSWGIWNRIFNRQTVQQDKNTVDKTPKIQEISISKKQQNIVVRGKNLSSVKVYFVGTGTGMDPEKIPGRDATKSSENNGEQVWTYIYPQDLLITNIYAKGFDQKGNIVGKVDLPIVGASSLAEALYESNPSQNIDWKTYTNTEYGFEIKYNPKYKLSARVDVTGPGDTTGQLSVQIGFFSDTAPVVPSYSYTIIARKGISTISELERFFMNPQLMSKVQPITNTTLGGQTAVDMKFYQEVGAGYYYHAIGTVKNNILYIVNKEQMDNNSDLDEEFNQMISTFKFTNSQASITILSPKGNETWQIGTSQSIKYSTSSNMPKAGTCVDVYAIDSKQSKTALSLGNYIGITEKDGINIVPGLGDSDGIMPGAYRIELDVHSCAETNNTFITSTVSTGFITITANPNFIKPTITQIIPSQGREKDIITISGSNLSNVTGILLSPIGSNPVMGWTAYTNIISKSQNSITFGFKNTYGELPAGTYQINLISPTGRSNLLNFTFLGQ